MTSPDDIRIQPSPTTSVGITETAATAKPKRSVGKTPTAESEVRGGSEAALRSLADAPLETLTSKVEPRFVEIDPSLEIALEQRIREHAYYLWQAAGEPEGSDLEFWQQASAQRIK